VGAVDPGRIHAGVQQRHHEVGVVGGFARERHHDPGGSAGAHRPEDRVGVGGQDLIALVEGGVDRVEIPRAGVATQRGQDVAGGVHLGLDVCLGRGQRGGPDVHEVVLQLPPVAVAQDRVLHEVHRPPAVNRGDGFDGDGVTRLGIGEVVKQGVEPGDQHIQ